MVTDGVVMDEISFIINLLDQDEAGVEQLQLMNSLTIDTLLVIIKLKVGGIIKLFILYCILLHQALYYLL